MCIFCKIINKEIPCYKIYEDEYTLAFLDIEPTSYGHTLVIPKKHVVNMLDCDNETFKHVTNTLHKVIQHYKDVLNIEGVNILNNSGELAGQTVYHLHYHIIPKGIDKDKLNFEEIYNTMKI